MPDERRRGAFEARPGSSDDARFAFGENWRRFLRLVDEPRIAAAEASLRDMLEVDRLDGRRFLDVGCGSGLFSLAARRLGATVRSFDHDADSVGCALELRRRYREGDESWCIEQGSILDAPYVASLGAWDVVYAWGVLHHTGDMWRAFDHVSRLVAPRGRLFLAIYNDQGAASRAWSVIKRAYVSGPVGRAVVSATFMPAFVSAWAAYDVGRGRSPLARYERHPRARGMSMVRDLVDWLGGYPFEVATPDAVLDFFRPRGFGLTRLRTVGGSSGNNEFVFARE